MLKNLATTILAEQNHVERIPARAFDLHARATHGHAGYRQASALWALNEQTTNFLRRHVALERVTIHHGGVARRHIGWHTKAQPVGSGFRYIVRNHFKTVLLEMADSLDTTAAAGCFEHINLRFLFGARQTRRDQTDE